MNPQNTTRETFLKNLDQDAFFSEFKELVTHPFEQFSLVEYQIIPEDITDIKHLQFDALNILILGDTKVDWLDLRNSLQYGGADLGGTVFIKGNVVVNDFNNEYHKMVVVQQNMKVNSILNNDFPQAELLVKGNLQAQYLQNNIGKIRVGGFSQFEYGEGMAMPLSSENAQEAVHPKFGKPESLDHLGINDPTLNAKQIEELVQKIIEERNR